MKYLIFIGLVAGCVSTPNVSQTAPEYIPCAQIISAWDHNVSALAQASTISNMPFFVGTVLRGSEHVLRDRRNRLEKRMRGCGL